MTKNLRYFPRVMLLLWRAAKHWLLVWLLLLILQSLLPIFLVILTRTTVDGVVGFVNNGGDQQQLEMLILPVALLGIVLVLMSTLDSILAWIRTAQSELIRDHVSTLVQAQALRLDLKYYEQQEFYDLIHRVQQQARNQPLVMLDSFGGLIRSSLTLLGLATLLVSYGWWLLPLLIVGALPSLWSVARFTRRLNKWRLTSTQRERRASYYDFLITERLAAGELRIFNLGEHHSKLYADLRAVLRAEKLKLWGQKALIDVLATLVAVGVVGIVMVWMGWQVLVGAATVGDLAALYQIFNQVQSSLGSTVGQAGSLYQSILFIADLFDYLDLEPNFTRDDGADAPPLAHEIRIENVSFQYPGTERYAIRHFSTTLPAGKIVALVGANGEGKTTLMKLLCRFYDPQQGRILWDGIPLTELSVGSLQRQITILFQNPYLYPETIAMNIAFGDLEAQPTREAIERAARSASADAFIHHLPKGFDTQLGKVFGGEELSIGQWQRLALSRTLVRNASLILLDEPTSAMDAWAEMSWLNGIREVVHGRTLLMITHRFTTAMQADLILVLKDQQIVEQGSHAALLALNGYYAASWHEQVQQHNKDTSN